MSSISHLEGNIYQAHFPTDLNLTNFVDAKFDVGNDRDREVLLMSTYLRFLIRNQTGQVIKESLPPVDLQRGQAYRLEQIIATLLARNEINTSDADTLVDQVLTVVKDTGVTVIFGPQQKVVQ